MFGRRLCQSTETIGHSQTGRMNSFPSAWILVTSEIIVLSSLQRRSHREAERRQRESEPSSADTGTSWAVRSGYVHGRHPRERVLAGRGVCSDEVGELL